MIRMLKKAVMITLVLFGVGLTYAALRDESDTVRSPASIPLNFESLSGCEKQSQLWERAEASEYKVRPEYRKFSVMQLLAMSVQRLTLKGNTHSDFAPDGWKKYLHRRGALAKVRIVPRSSRYTGVFQGSDCSLLRLSLTYKTDGDKPVAPGLALKVLRDGIHSANVSALVSLDGQGKDFNFLALRGIEWVKSDESRSLEAFFG